MQFSRRVTKLDFENGFDIEPYARKIYNLRTMSELPEDIKVQIETGCVSQAICMLRQNWNLSIQDAKTIVKDIQNFNQAKEDFENGHDVFVTY